MLANCHDEHHSSMCWCWCLVSICSMVVVLSCCPQLGGRGGASASHLANTETASSRNTSSVFNIIAYWKIEKNSERIPAKSVSANIKLNEKKPFIPHILGHGTGIHQRSELSMRARELPRTAINRDGKIRS